MITARDFIRYVLVPLQQAWGYIYGTAGKMWTAALQESWSQPGHKNYEQTAKYGAQWIGRKVTDCSGLLCWALKQLGASIVHQARYQYTDACKTKGQLINGKREDGSPILPGTAVFLQGTEARIHHVGVYVGHGICVEAKGTRWGVVTSELEHWDHWGELEMVDYTDAAQLEEEPLPEIPKEHSDALRRAVVDNPGKWVNVRSGPGTSYQAQYRLYKGDIVDVLAVSPDGKWDQIRYEGWTGWVSAEYLKDLDADAPKEPDDPEPPEQQHPPDEEARAWQLIDQGQRLLDEGLAILKALRAEEGTS